MDTNTKPDEPRSARGRWRRRGVRLAKWLGLGALLLLALREVFFSGPYRRLAKPHDGMILDMHCHMAGIGAGAAAALFRGSCGTTSGSTFTWTPLV